MINYRYLRPKKAEAVKTWYDKDFIKRDNLTAISYYNATILPLKKCPSDRLLFGRGGVVDAEGRYIEASSLRKRIDYSYEYDAYEVQEKKVVYCGYMVPQWGHFLVEAVTRLWYFLKHDDTIDKYVFFLSLGEEREIKGNYREFFELLGVWDKLEFINKPTQYREVIVPEKAFSMRTYWSNEYKEIFDTVAGNVNIEEDWNSYDKIFLSRSRIPKFGKKEFNMDMLDEFFEKNGYKIVYPEHHSLANLIYLMKNAEEIATLSGSVQHNMMFAPDRKKHIIIEKTVVTVDFQIDINLMKDFDVTYIDANLPIYPISIGYGPYIMYYSGMLRKFAEERGYLPADPSFEDKNRMKKIFSKYMKAYREEYQYQWFLADWEEQFISSIREGYLEGFEYFKEYLTRQKPYKVSHYFELHYWKNFVRKMIGRK